MAARPSMSPNIRRHKVNKIRLGLSITQAAAHVSSAESEEGEEREKMRRTWYRTPVARHAPLSDGHCPSRPKTTKRETRAKTSVSSGGWHGGTLGIWKREAKSRQNREGKWRLAQKEERGEW